MFAWDKPWDDGGSPITHYIVEAMDLESRGHWRQVGETPGDQLSLKIENLQEKHRYKFRVFAANKAGISDAAEIAESVLAKNPWGTDAC